MQLQNFLERYRQGERNFINIDLSGVNLTGANLQNINLTNANLSGANLSWASLNQAKFTGANLHQADLHNSLLNNADFNQAILSRAKLNKVDLRLATLREADLNWADLSGANLSGTELQNAQMDRVNLEQAKLDHAQLMGAQLMEANLRYASLIMANLTGANLREADLEQANLRDAIFLEANLTEANLNAAYLRASNLTQVDLHRAILSNADLSDANCEGADFSRANLNGAYLLRTCLRKADLQRAILQDVYLLRADLSEANLRGADLRRADLSAAYLKDTLLNEANLSEAFLLKSYLIRTKLEGAQLTGCCIYNWYLEDVDLSEVECRYVFTQFNYATKSPSDRYPTTADLQPGQLSQHNAPDALIINVRFQDAPNWQVLAFTLTQVELECQNIQLTIKSYELREEQYLLRLSVNRLVNIKLLSQRILQLYPEILQRFCVQRQSLLDLLEIKETQDLIIEFVPKPLAPSRSQISSSERRRQLYQEVVVQIQRIIMFQAPEQFLDSVERLLVFLRQQNISTEEIQKQVISQVIRKRAKKDTLFQDKLRQWQEKADNAARFSLVGQAIYLGIALIESEDKSP